MSFFDRYFQYADTGDTPILYHRWSAISLVSTLLARNIWIENGDYKIFPNLYVLLIGSSGTKKENAINKVDTLLSKMNYSYYAHNKSSFEGILRELSQQAKNYIYKEDELLDSLILDDNDKKDSPIITQSYILHSDFPAFLGHGEESMLGGLSDLWQCKSYYTVGKSRQIPMEVPNPTINILVGSNKESLAHKIGKMDSFASFGSVSILVHSNPLGIKVPFYPSSNPVLVNNIVNHLSEIQQISGQVHLTKAVKDFLTDVEMSAPPLELDLLKGYPSNRQNQLFKLVSTIAAMDLTTTPTLDHCLFANTILANTEQYMSDALLGFGQGKYSHVINKILLLIQQSTTPLNLINITAYVYHDVDKPHVVQELIHTLLVAGKIQKVTIGEKAHYIDKANSRPKWKEGLVNYSLLHPHEHSEDEENVELFSGSDDDYTSVERRG